MAKACSVCGKGTVFGKNVSHAHNVTSRTWTPEGTESGASHT